MTGDPFRRRQSLTLSDPLDWQRPDKPLKVPPEFSTVLNLCSQKIGERIAEGLGKPKPLPQAAWLIGAIAQECQSLRDWDLERVKLEVKFQAMIALSGQNHYVRVHDAAAQASALLGLPLIVHGHIAGKRCTVVAVDREAARSKLSAHVGCWSAIADRVDQAWNHVRSDLINCESSGTEAATAALPPSRQQSMVPAEAATTARIPEEVNGIRYRHLRNGALFCTLSGLSKAEKWRMFGSEHDMVRADLVTLASLGWVAELIPVVDAHLSGTKLLSSDEKSIMIHAMSGGKRKNWPKANKEQHKMSPRDRLLDRLHRMKALAAFEKTPLLRVVRAIRRMVLIIKRQFGDTRANRLGLAVQRHRSEFINWIAAEHQRLHDNVAFINQDSLFFTDNKLDDRIIRRAIERFNMRPGTKFHVKGLNHE